MTFLTPAALVGLLAAVTPVAIYLFLRRRKTEINWGASYLLRLTLASKKKTSLWRQFVVLAVRTAILALAGFLIAQPFIAGPHPSSDTPAMPERAVHRVVLFDNSRSMTVTEDNLTRLDRARSAAASLLRSQRTGDTLDLIPLIPAQGCALEPVTLEDTPDENATQHALAAVPTRDGLVVLEPALAAAMTRLATTPGSAGEIYLLSDFPRELESQAARVTWFAPLAKERAVRLAAVNMIGPTDGKPQANVSLDSVTLGSDILVAGVPTRLYIDASNHSDREAVATFTITVGSATSPLKQQTVRLNPDEHKRIAVALTLAAGNGQVLKIAVQPSLLEAHATRYLSVDVKDALDVWLVADEKDPAAGPSTEPDDTEFFQRAIKQRKDQAAGIRLKNARMNDLTLPIPETVDAIILAAPHYTNPAIAAPLTDFVRRGGGLLLTTSAALQLPAFNENVGPLLPAMLDKPIREKLDPETYLQAQIESAAGPLFEEFAQGSTAVAGDLGQARFYNHFRLQNPDTVSGVVLRLSNGDPLVIEKRIGRGHVFLFTSTLGVAWTSLPVRQSFIPLITRILSAAVAGRTLPLNLVSGENFVTPWPAKGSATLTLPDTSTKSVPVLDAAAGQFIVLDKPRDAGLYQLADAAGNKRAFTVIGSAAETDLRSLPESARSKLAASLGTEVHPDWSAAVRALGPSGATAPLWPWLLILMLSLYVFESWFIKTL